MDDEASLTADTLELLLLNQVAIRAALEEQSLWVSQRGSVHVHGNIIGALQALNVNADAISASIAELRE